MCTGLVQVFFWLFLRLYFPFSKLFFVVVWLVLFCTLVGYSFMHIDFRSVLFICSGARGGVQDTQDMERWSLASELFVWQCLFMCRNWLVRKKVKKKKQKNGKGC